MEAFKKFILLVLLTVVIFVIGTLLIQPTKMYMLAVVILGVIYAYVFNAIVKMTPKEK